MNSITELLDLEDADIFISDISISGTQKILTIETRPETHFCPICGFRMHSRGLKTRTINHPVLQDTYELVLKLKYYQTLYNKLIFNFSCRIEEVPA